MYQRSLHVTIAASTSHTVHIGIDISGEVHIYHQVDAVDINATCNLEEEWISYFCKMRSVFRYTHQITAYKDTKFKITHLFHHFETLFLS